MSGSTDISIVLELFRDKLESCTELVDYFNITSDEVEVIITERGRSLLREAVALVRRKAELAFTLALTGADEAMAFVEAITEDEADLLANGMVYLFYERQRARLMPKLMMFQTSEAKSLFSPAQERVSFEAAVAAKRNDFLSDLRAYASKDRETGKWLRPTYDLAADTEA